MLIFHPGSRVDKIPDPHQRILGFLTQKIDTKFAKIRSGMFIPDPGRRRKNNRKNIRNKRR